MNYTLDHDPIDGGHLVIATGELDVAATPQLTTVLAMTSTAPGRRVVLDLAGVEFIDSSALGTLLKAGSELEQADKVLEVVAPQGAVRRLLELTNLTGRFSLHETRDDALAAAPA
jgi:anti-anti-sigma factor